MSQDDPSHGSESPRGEDLPVDGAEPRIESVADLVALLSTLEPDKPTWFRGQVDQGWTLVPSVLRKAGWLKAEGDMLKLFRQEVAGRTSARPAHEWDWVCLAQHHRLPTRLLDWSTNPLIGLYFAVEVDDGDAGPADGALYSLDPTGLNQRSFGAPSILLLGADRDLDDYLLSSPSQQKRDPVAVVAQQSFGRLIAQSGVFTLTHHKDPTPLATSLEPMLARWVVPLAAKEKIRNELATMNIHSASVYVDPDKFALRIRKSHE